MSQSVTLKLNDELLAQAQVIAGNSRQSVEEVLADWLMHYTEHLPVESLPDERVLALCYFELNPIAQYELRSLLYYLSERDLTITERTRLDDILRHYRRGIIRKARAIEVAQARGLENIPAF